MTIKNFRILKQGSNYQIVTNYKEIALYSYGTLIVTENLNTGQIVLDEKFWNFSNTTAKHRIKFLNESTAETRKKIESGEYKVKNLN